MRRNLEATLVLVTLVLVMAGCYEEHGTIEATPQAEPAAETPAAPGGEGATYGNTANPGHAGAVQAARNTEDRIAERQRELEKALEDQD